MLGWLLSAAFVLIASGCASTEDTATEPTEPTSLDTSISQPASGGAESTAAGRATTIVARDQYAPDAPPGSPLGQRVIYFEFDSATVPAQYRPVVEAHAEYLRERPRLIVTLEGHADELGTREYNIALGERRGQAVRRLMQFQGVEAAQLEVVSYGEERPAMGGQDESSWTKNRRVEILYSGERQ
jgi:peptidoglycan-associated lipoprotein